MIAVDTNILVYAHRKDSVWHDPAIKLVRGLVEGSAAWAIPWPCIHEFIATVTHRRVYSPPSTLNEAFHQAGIWLKSPTAFALSETADHLARIERLAVAAKIIGGAIHDAKIAALCLQHGVSELWSADRDFAKFPALKVRNPLLA